MKIDLYNAGNAFRQWQALETLADPNSRQTGLQLYIKLARLEKKANRLATRDCNGEPVPENWQENVTRSVEKIMGRIPAGFFINCDPRGYTLKIKEAHKPAGIYNDIGSYGILAPQY